MNSHKTANTKGAMHSLTGYLTPASPFDFAQSMKFMECFPPMQGEQTLSQTSLVKALLIQGQMIACELSSISTVDTPQLYYRLVSPEPISERIKAAAIDRIEFFLGLREDLRSFYALGLKDQAFAPIVQKLYGYHQVKFTTPFENACWAILSQRNPMTFARKRKQALAGWFDNRVWMEGKDYLAFPEPRQILTLDTEILNNLICNRRKTECLQAVASAFDEVDEGFLRKGDYDAVESWLRSIKGIGDWSATFILIRGLGRMERAASERKLVECAARVYGEQQAQTQKDVLQLAQTYGIWQGYWAHYLRVWAY
jgi:DNA-3-methyladenine glycosylase II